MLKISGLSFFVPNFSSARLSHIILGYTEHMPFDQQFSSLQHHPLRLMFSMAIDQNTANWLSLINDERQQKIRHYPLWFLLCAKVFRLSEAHFRNVGNKIKQAVHNNKKKTSTGQASKRTGNAKPKPAFAWSKPPAIISDSDGVPSDI